MRAQLEIQDAEGRNLAMLAARCGNVAILKSVMAEIHHTGVRERAVCADLAAIFLEPSQNSRKRSFASISLLAFCHRRPRSSCRIHPLLAPHDGPGDHVCSQAKPLRIRLKGIL